jgi:predicted dehydrogenase
VTEKLRVACYGTNGHQILQQLADHPRAQLVAVSEIDAAQVAVPEGVRFEDDLDALIAADDVDLISLCSPRRDEQFGQAVRCLRAGKHVLAEKPATMTVEQLHELIRVTDECEAEFRQMGACYQEAVLSAIRKVVDEGRLGEVVHVFAHKSYPYKEWRPQDRGVDGGLIRQAGIHGVRFIQLATGLKAVRACGLDTGLGNPKDGELQMAASVALELEGGAVATLMCNYLNPPGFGSWGNAHLRVHGTKGMIEAVDDMRRRRMIIGEGAEEAIPDVPQSYPVFFDSYADYLLDGTPMPYSAEDDLYALRTVIRAQEAVDAGCIVEV